MSDDNEITVKGRRYLTVEAAAILAGRSVGTIWRWSKEGSIRTRKVLRSTVFDALDVEKQAGVRR